MKKLGKLTASVLAIALVGNVAAAQGIAWQKSFSSLSAAYRSKLEHGLNNGPLTVRPDTLKALAPDLRRHFQQYHLNRIPGMEVMPNLNPIPLDRWKMPLAPIDSTLHYRIQQKMVPRQKESPQDFQFKGREMPQDKNPQLKN